MAKIASSKPYGSGKTKTPTKPTTTNKKEIEISSPLRTSPRRRKSLVSEDNETAKEVAEEVKTGKSRKPAAPKFSEKKQKVVAEGSPAKPKTPKRGRRKSALEPETIEQVNEQVDEIEEIFKYVDSNRFATEDEEDYIGSSIQQESESTSIYVPSEEQIENSPIFEEVERFENSEDYEHETTPSDEEVAFHFDEDEEDVSEGSNSEALNEEEEYNDQFRYDSSNVRLRLAQYFQRQESALSSASSLKSQLWSKMKEWVSESVIPTAKELGEVTVEYTKKAIEQLSKRLEKREEPVIDENDVSVYEDEPRIYEITDEGEEVENEMMDDHYADNKKAKLMDDIEVEDQTEIQDDQNQFYEGQAENDLQYQSSSYHSVPEADETLMIVEPETPQQTPKIAFNDVMDSRLTEIVLFFAKCTGDTPISAIYEHLEEFFMLKGENSLNFTEKQLVSTVIKDFLTEKEEQTQAPPVPAYEPVVLSTESPKRIKVLPSSGIRFRAPKFTPEEEARLEELEQMRQKNLATASNRISTLSTPQQRNKMQKKLLAPEMTAELIEKLPENRGRAADTKAKSDSVTSAIEDIISQKIKEAKQREEAERLETEKLKARVAELERESRERATKEALLQKQIEEQKKELEIEKAAAREKLESLKAAANLKKEKEVKSTFNIGEEKAPTAGGFNFGEPAKPAGFSGFSFGAKAEEVKSEEQPKATLTPFASFSFGKAKAAETPADEKSESPEKSVLNPEAAAFKPAASFGFSFGGNSKEPTIGSEAKKEEKSQFSFGSADAKFTVGEAQKPAAFTFGASTEKSSGAPASITSEKPAAFSFGASTAIDKPAFNFGVEKPVTSASTFSIGSADKASTTATTTPAFNFGSTDKASSTTNTTNTTSTSTTPNSSAFNFGSADKAASFNFGTGDKSAPTASAFNFGSTDKSAVKETNPFGTQSNAFGSSAFNFGTSLSANNQGNTANVSNPFAALNSAANIFSSGAAPASSGAFSFGAPAAFPPAPSANAFSFPPISPSNAPIVSMNFGNATQPAANEQTGEMAFQTGSRAISIPKRRRK